ncbi:MAG TPA: ABC transporter substrate-binding protein [Acidimicrobiales bacterium]|nr:ABC transporter substrate-binding protein [Acidimicrobiales bacterium]
MVWTRRHRLVFLLVIGALLASACSSTGRPTARPPTSTSTRPAGSSQPPTGLVSPGVTATTVTVGQVDDLTLPIAGLFKGAEDGTQAYFDYINSQGGVNGRTLKLDAGDSLYSDGTAANTTAAQAKNDFALVGGFSLVDSAEESVIADTGIPDVAYPLDPGLSNLPSAYSPVPNNDNDFPVTIMKVLKRKFPTAVKHVGILWANDDAATMEAEKAFERGAKSQGFTIVYDASFMPSQTTFLANVLTMKAKGVQMFFTQQLPDAYAATVAKEMQQQDFHPINVEGDAYSASLIKEGGAAVNGMYIEIGYLLYLDADAALPAVKLFTKWMKRADSSANFELQALFGWASAELFVDGLRQAGSPPTRAGLEQALDRITSFNASGLLTTSDPARNVPGSCVVLAQVRNGHVVRVSPTPRTGFLCEPNSLLPAPGFKPEVRTVPSASG